MRYIVDLTEEQKAELEEYTTLSPWEEYGDFNVGFDQGIREAEQFLVYVTNDFLKGCFYEVNESGYVLYDLICKYGLRQIIDNFKAWEKEKNIKQFSIGQKVFIRSLHKYGLITRIVNDNLLQVLLSNGSSRYIDADKLIPTNKYYDLYKILGDLDSID